jgi:hypothetical protein
MWNADLCAVVEQRAETARTGVSMEDWSLHITVAFFMRLLVAKSTEIRQFTPRV